MIRSATLEDIQSITGIYNEAISEGGFTGDLAPLTVENRLSWFSDHHGRYAIFVKTIDGVIAGYTALSPYRKGRDAFNATCEISYYVSSQHRGRGLGKELINYGINYSDRTGFTTVLAIILATNTRSIDILLQIGFSISGRLPGVALIDGVCIDHLYLSRHVNPHHLP